MSALQWLEPKHATLLRKTVNILERDAYALRIIDFFGTPLDAPLKLTSSQKQRGLDRVLRKSMDLCMRWTKGTLRVHSPPQARGWLTQMAATSTGFIAGIFGAISIPIEIPLTIILILRSIAEVAERYPIPPDDMDRRLECLFVMSLAGRVKSPEPRSQYWSVRDAYRPVIIEAGRSIVISSATSSSAQGLLMVLENLMYQLGMALAEGIAARSIPIVGAAAGASMSFIIVSRYRRVAAAHFTLLALEDTYGLKVIREAFLEINDRKFHQKHRPVAINQGDVGR